MAKKNGSDGPALFEVGLQVDDKRLTILMNFDFDTGSVGYKTTWGAGQKAGFDPPVGVKRFMNKAFVDFYVFDGELADRLLQPKYTHAETAVESLFQLNIFRDMERPIESYWERQTQHVGAREQRGHSRRTNLLRRWKERREKLYHEREHWDAELSSVQESLRRAEEQYDVQLSQDRGRQRDVSEAEQLVTQLNDNVHASSRSLLEQMRDPHALAEGFADLVFELRETLDNTKLPESAAREFFEDLAAESECVCGRSIDADVRRAIQSRARSYLSSDNVSVLNAMKSQIADVVGDSRQAPAALVSRRVAKLDHESRALQQAKTQRDIVARKVEEPDHVLRDLGQQIGRLKIQRETITERLKAYNDRDEMVRLDQPSTVDIERVFSIETVSDGIERLTRAVEEVTKSRGLSQKRDLLIRVLESAMVKARTAITDAICEDTNDRIGALMPHNDIRVERIDGCLKLRDQEGGSAGETLSIGYAFLSTLLGRADQHRLPFIVDSPAIPIDLAVRPKIGELVPLLTDQFVAFVISSERNEFVPSVVRSGRGSVRLLTLFRKGATDYENTALASQGCTVTDDGMVVTDEGFFETFQHNTE